MLRSYADLTTSIINPNHAIVRRGCFISVVPSGSDCALVIYDHLGTPRHPFLSRQFGFSRIVLPNLEDQNLLLARERVVGANRIRVRKRCGDAPLLLLLGLDDRPRYAPRSGTPESVVAEGQARITAYSRPSSRSPRFSNTARRVRSHAACERSSLAPTLLAVARSDLPLES